MSHRIDVEIIGLSDRASVQKAEQAIRDNTGVQGVRVYLESGRASVDVERGYTLEHILESLESAGFMAREAASDA